VQSSRIHRHWPVSVKAAQKYGFQNSSLRSRDNCASRQAFARSSPERQRRMNSVISRRGGRVAHFPMARQHGLRAGDAGGTTRGHHRLQLRLVRLRPNPQNAIAVQQLRHPAGLGSRARQPREFDSAIVAAESPRSSRRFSSRSAALCPAENVCSRRAVSGLRSGQLPERRIGDFHTLGAAHKRPAPCFTFTSLPPACRPPAASPRPTPAPPSQSLPPRRPP